MKMKMKFHSTHCTTPLKIPHGIETAIEGEDNICFTLYGSVGHPTFTAD